MKNLTFATVALAAGLTVFAYPAASQPATEALSVMMDHCRARHEGADYTLQASMQLMAVGLFSLGSGFSAHWFGYSYHFLLSAGLCLAAIMAIPVWWHLRRHASTTRDLETLP